MNLLPKLALFDDDESNLKIYNGFLKEHFELLGYQNPFLYEEALNKDVSAIIIDVIMPVMDGVSLYNEIKKHPHYNGCPILFISASGSEEVMLNAFKIGGQDFLTRTMKKEEILSRVQNKITYFQENRQIFKLGNVKVNTSELKAYSSDGLVDLTLTEMRIMKFLIRSYPKLSTREEINQEVWPGQKVMPTTLNTHLSNLRNKLPKWEYEIQIVKTKGVELTPKNSGLKAL